ncbi:hypothetical protein [Natronincola ferrireducens]|uniref:Uncharacterized protein n=1 Tax=Natronincola ferrireducens TaxID=393762 RepID=A0A1G8XRW9_9FIRM|nr:hypothetical protein [Natronincola ferrireducens]SDJ93412.1 hypothetical protein SAMN05660472_00312 [Natronincola ferrireducens]
METVPLKVVVLNAIPEAIVLMYLGLTLIGIKPDKKRVVVAGILQGAAYYYIRKNVDFGTHIFMQCASFVLLTWLIVKVSFIASVIANTVSITLAILLESSIGFMIAYITGITITEMMSREWIRVLWCLPYLFVILFITFLVGKYKFTLEEEISLIKKIDKRVKG